MEVFEEKYKEYYLTDRCTGTTEEKETAKIFWRTTLEWVLKTAEELEEQDAPIFMQDVIKQELESD